MTRICLFPKYNQNNSKKISQKSHKKSHFPREKGKEMDELSARELYIKEIKFFRVR